MNEFCFEIDFECNNCGYTWTEQFKKNERVIKNKITNQIKAISERGFYKFIFCKNCGSYLIGNSQRRPLI